MDIKELLDKANEGYPDGFLAEYYDDEGNFREGRGDTLAEFIVVELIETFDPDATEEEQLDEAVRVMSSEVMWVGLAEKVHEKLKHGGGSQSARFWSPAGSLGYRTSGRRDLQGWDLDWVDEVYCGECDARIPTTQLGEIEEWDYQ